MVTVRVRVRVRVRVGVRVKGLEFDHLLIYELRRPYVVDGIACNAGSLGNVLVTHGTFHANYQIKPPNMVNGG